MTVRVVPQQVISDVCMFVVGEFYDAEKHDNRAVLDDDGVHGLFNLAADIYAAGYEAGARAEATRADARRQIGRARAKAAAAGETP